MATDESKQRNSGSIPSRKQKEEEFRRNLILDIAEQLFSEKGYQQTTVADIAERAELAKGSLYNLFENKEDIFRAMAVRKMGHLFEVLMQIVESDLSPTEKIISLIRLKLTKFRENRDFAKIFMDEFKGFHLLRTGHIMEFHKKEGSCYTDSIRKIFVDGQNSGEFRNDVPVELLISSFHGITNGVIVKWLSEPDSFDFENALEKLPWIFTEGILHHKNHKKLNENQNAITKISDI